MAKPALPMILGSGPMADEMRQMLADDPDRFRPETWGIDAIGKCPCCKHEVYRVTCRETGWEEGFATHEKVVHPRMNEQAKHDPNGQQVGCCCVAPNWGPLHSRRAVKKKRR